MASMEAREKFALITESLAEVLNPELIESVLAEGRNLRVYWGSFTSTMPSPLVLGARKLC